MWEDALRVAPTAARDVAQRKLIIEVALNEYVERDENGHVPLTESEIASQIEECVAAGAAIVHFHPRSHRPDDPLDTRAEDVEYYARTLDLLPESCDVIAYPTYSLRWGQEGGVFSHVRELRESSSFPLETFVFFVGATNLGYWSHAGGRWVGDGASGLSHEAATEFLAWCRSSGVKPQLGVREVGHLRHVQLYRDLGLIDRPVVVHLGLSSARPFGVPPSPGGVLGLLQRVPADWDAEWFVHCYHNRRTSNPGDQERHRLMNVLAICLGGHVRTGLGDLPRWDGRPLRSSEMIDRLTSVAATVGRQVATPGEAREILGFAG
jgi:3-keto-5-aminohexanoate cleavage enzyme